MTGAYGLSTGTVRQRNTLCTTQLTSFRLGVSDDRVARSKKSQVENRFRPTKREKKSFPFEIKFTGERSPNSCVLSPKVTTQFKFSKI